MFEMLGCPCLSSFEPPLLAAPELSETVSRNSVRAKTASKTKVVVLRGTRKEGWEAEHWTEGRVERSIGMSYYESYLQSEPRLGHVVDAVAVVMLISPWSL